MDGLIYGLYCSDESCTPEIKYVGQTINSVESRFNSHLNSSAKTLVSKWIRDHGARYVRYEVLEAEVARDQLDARERFWVKEKGTFAGHGQGLNSDKGGTPHDLDDEELEFRHALDTRNASRKKLTWTDVREIRRLYAETDTYIEDIASRFGVVQGTVMSVVMGVTWKDPDYRYVRRSRKAWRPETAGASKLTWELVRQIRESYVSEGETLTSLQEKYGLSKGTIHRVARNRSWVDPNYTPPKAWTANPYSNRRHCALTMEQAEEVRATFKRGGVTRKQLSDTFGVTPQTISSILTGKTYRHDGKIQVVP